MSLGVCSVLRNVRWTCETPKPFDSSCVVMPAWLTT